jgi:ERCC4-type nuclease
MIIADSREERNKKRDSEKQYIFNSLKEKCKEVEQKQLEIGDYLLDNNYIIERKDDDLVSSITSKRIFDQLNGLCMYEHPILVITTKNLWKQFYFTNSRWIHSSYMGLLTTLVTSYPNLKLVFLEDTEEFVKFIVSLDKKIHDEGTSERSKFLAKKPVTIEDSMENVISGVKGVSIRTAKELLKNKKSVKAIANSTKEELMQIPNIGEKTANEIINTLCGEYESKT